MSALELGITNLDLTGMERTVLGHLLMNAGTVVSRADLHTASYPLGATPIASNVLEVIVSRLRKKVAAAGVPIAITTLRGRGYRLDAIEHADA